MVFDVKHDRIWSTCNNTFAIYTWPIDLKPLCDKDCEMFCDHHNSFRVKFASLERPKQTENSSTFSSDRWYACFSEDGNRIYTIFRNIDDICYLSWFNIETDGNNKITLGSKGPTFIIPSRHCVGLGYINDK